MTFERKFLIGSLMTILLSLTHSFSAQADVLQEILAAKSVADLDAKQISRVLRSDRQASCEAQLKLRAIPRDCFTSELVARPLQLASLTRLCIANARSSRSRLELAEAMSQKSAVPDSCLRVVRERQEDLKYVDELQHPEMSVARTSGPELEE